MHLSNKGIREPGENSTKTFRQRTHTNPDIDSAAEDPMYASKNPKVRETYLSSVYGNFLSGGRASTTSWLPSVQPDNSSKTPHRPKSRNGTDAVLQKTIALLAGIRFRTLMQTPEKHCRSRARLQRH
jgi:hypothetical protein